MKNLRLVFDNEDGRKEDIVLPMEKWISDWWYECNVVPSNDTNILIAELDGKSILSDIKAVNERCVIFEEIAWHFNWDGLHDDFIGTLKKNLLFKNDSVSFEKWLLENITR